MTCKLLLPESRNIIFSPSRTGLIYKRILFSLHVNKICLLNCFSAVNRNNLNHSCCINQKYFCTRLILPLTELTVLSSFERQMNGFYSKSRCQSNHFLAASLVMCQLNKAEHARCFSGSRSRNLVDFLQDLVQLYSFVLGSK